MQRSVQLSKEFIAGPGMWKVSKTRHLRKLLLNTVVHRIVLE